jgi:hypothetical protein
MMGESRVCFICGFECERESTMDDHLLNQHGINEMGRRARYLGHHEASRTTVTTVTCSCGESHGPSDFVRHLESRNAAALQRIQAKYERECDVLNAKEWARGGNAQGHYNDDPGPGKGREYKARLLQIQKELRIKVRRQMDP